MSYIGLDSWAQDIASDNDRKNQEIINRAIADGRINDEAGEYLKGLYSNSMHWFREVFYVLGKCFGRLCRFSIILACTHRFRKAFVSI